MIALRFIDRIGRKKLLLIGAIGTACALAGVAVIMGTGEGKGLLLAMLIVFISFFAFSQGAVIWVYLAEIFPTAVRSRGQALGSATHWGMNAIIGQLFPMIAVYTQALPFAFFAACMVVQFFVVLAIFPETRGVELESMDKALAERAKRCGSCRLAMMRQLNRRDRHDSISRRSVMPGLGAAGAAGIRAGARRLRRSSPRPRPRCSRRCCSPTGPGSARYREDNAKLLAARREGGRRVPGRFDHRRLGAQPMPSSSRRAMWGAASARRPRRSCWCACTRMSSR